MVLHWRSPLIIAHRGASAKAPENTLAAFELAIQENADMIELDTKLTVDEEVVVIHDQTVNRTTDGIGKVRNLTLAELRELNAGFLKGGAYPSEKIPTLEEVFEACGDKILFNIELTNYLTPFDSLAEKIQQLIVHFSLEDDVLVSSFYPSPLRYFQKLSPEYPIGLLAKSGYAGILSRSWLGRSVVNYHSLHPEKNDVTPELVSKGHRFGKKIYPYTVNQPNEIMKLISMGVDGIITDDPALVHKTISPFK